MKITINNKEYEICFNYNFVKYVMAFKKWDKFTDYYAYIGKMAFEEADFAPKHFDAVAELVWFGISAANNRKSNVTTEDIASVLWADMDLFKDVLEHFSKSQPKAEKSVVDPSARNGGK